MAPNLDTFPGFLGLPLIRTFRRPGFAWTVAVFVTAVLVAAYLWAHVVIVLAARQPPAADDFYMYYQGAWSLRTLGDPYAIPNPDLHAPWDPRITTTYIYPPLFAGLLVPVTFLPAGVVVRLWIVLMQLLAVGALVLVYRALGRPTRGELLAMAAVAASFMPLIANALTGAMNTLLLFLCALALPALLRQQQRRAGFFLGLAVGIKLFPAALLPYLAFRRLGRALLYAGLTLAGTLLIGVAITRPAALAHYLFDLLPALGSGNGYRENQSLLGFFTRLCGPGGPDGASAGPGWCARALTIPADLLLFAGLWVATARGPLDRLSADARDRRRALEYSLAVVTVPLVASVTWGLHLVLVLLPLAVLLRCLVAEGGLTRSRAVLLLGVIACFSVLRGAYYTAIVYSLATPTATVPLVLVAVRLASESYFIGLLLLWGLLFFYSMSRSNGSSASVSGTIARA